MYTHCPHCETCFHVTSAQLKSANGKVRCGRCFGTFNALQHLVDGPAGETSQQDTHDADGKILPDTTDTGRYSKREHSQQLIEELQNAATSGGMRKRLLWGLSGTLLIALVLVQLAYFNLDSLSQQAQYRPALIQLCKVLDCKVPLLKAPQQIALLHRDIRTHADKRGVLVVNAVLHNQAGFTQPFPVMEFSMQDITGNTIISRRYTPDEYLADKSLNIKAGIGANQSNRILLELVDPGEDAVGFEFNFF